MRHVGSTLGATLFFISIIINVRAANEICGFVQCVFILQWDWQRDWTGLALHTQSWKPQFHLAVVSKCEWDWDGIGTGFGKDGKRTV